MPYPDFEREIGEEIKPNDSKNPMAGSLIGFLTGEEFPYARPVSVYRSSCGVETVKFEVDVERPQRPEVPIERLELIAAQFTDDLQPNVYALRSGFPTEALHLFLGAKDDPPWLCLDERPWVEVKPRWTAFNFVERVRWWLAATAKGELHGEAQPAEPMFLASTGIILPAELFRGDWDANRSLEIHKINYTAQPHTIVMREGKPGGKQSDEFLPIFFIAQPQIMQRLRSAPANLSELNDAVAGWSIELIKALREHLLALLDADPKKLLCRPLLLLYVPLLRSDGLTTGQADLKAFMTAAEYNLAQIGIELGIFYPAEADIGKSCPVARRLQPDVGMIGEKVSTSILSVHQNYGRDVAESGSGLSADTRAVTLVGAGAIGSHLIEIMRRDGFGKWTVIDNDAFLPHNVQRHRVGEPLVGSPKAEVTAKLIDWVVGTKSETTPVCADVLHNNSAADASLQSAELIIDASASIPVARFLSDLESAAPRLSVFFNTVGRDVVLIGEDQERSIPLAALEAQYYRAVLDLPTLTSHLSEKGSGYQYAGSCRSVSFKMPEHQVSMLTGAIAGEIRRHLNEKAATIVVWVGDPEAGLKREVVSTYPIDRQSIAGWEIIVDDAVIESAAKYRADALPSETGGILLGTIDIPRHQICVVKLVAAPKDSFGTPEGFERGVKNLSAIVDDARLRTAGQVEYIGEWHSHPKGVRPSPSATDVKQLVWLGAERRVEGLPTLMMIAGDRKKFTLNMAIPI